MVMGLVITSTMQKALIKAVVVEKVKAAKVEQQMARREKELRELKKVVQRLYAARE